MKKWFGAIFLLLVILMTSCAQASNGDRIVITPVPESERTNFVPPISDNTKYIRGADNRVLASRLEYPYTAIAMITSYQSCGCSIATNGFLIGPHTMLTCAETAVCSQHGGKAEHMDIFFGYDCDTDYLYYTNKFRAYPMTDFSGRDGGHYFDTENDYCFIELEENVGYQLGWFGLTARTDEQLKNHTFRVAGYSNWQMKTTLGTLELMDAGNRRVDPLNGDEFRCTADMSPHWRGAPMFDANYNVMGIIVSSNSVPITFGQRINGEILQDELCQVNEWYEAYVSSKPSITIPVEELSGTGLAGRWKLVSTTKSEYANEAFQSGSNGSELVFTEDGTLKTLTLVNGKVILSISQAYAYKDNTLYTVKIGNPQKILEPSSECEVVLRGDTLTFTTNSQVDTYQRIE